MELELPFPEVLGAFISDADMRHAMPKPSENRPATDSAVSAYRKLQWCPWHIYPAHQTTTFVRTECNLQCEDL